jgi:hypothetical protein
MPRFHKKYASLSQKKSLAAITAMPQWPVRPWLKAFSVVY